VPVLVQLAVEVLPLVLVSVLAVSAALVPGLPFEAVPPLVPVSVAHLVFTQQIQIRT
jgi:hypothetical protein